MLNRRMFLRQGISAALMFTGAGVTSYRLLNPSDPTPNMDQAIDLNTDSARLIKEVRQAEKDIKQVAAQASVQNIPAEKGKSVVTQIAKAAESVSKVPTNDSIVAVNERNIPSDNSTLYLNLDQEQIEAATVRKPTVEVDSEEVGRAAIDRNPHAAADSWRQKILRFDEDLPGDIFLTSEQQTLLVAATRRIARVQKYVGYGNFNLLSFDSMLFHARNQEVIGEFTAAELGFLEWIFGQDAKVLGFMGDRVINSVTAEFTDHDVTKVPGSGHYLYRGVSEVHFKKISESLGDNLVLTSGIRSIVKQYHLFLAKAVTVNGNLSRASRSLAPPGYSYHAVGDFDVGEKGLGSSNFTSEFADSDIFRRLTDLGFIKIRYTLDNRFGVRFEPWHIRVV